MAGAAELRLVLQLSANDATGGAFKSVEQKTKRFTRNTRKEFQSLLDVGSSYRKLVGAIVTGKVLARGFAYLEDTIRDVTMSIVDMDTTLVAASAKWGPETHKGTAAFAQMEMTARELAGTTEYTASEVSKGMDFMAMAGFGFEQSMKAMVPLTDLATAAQMDLARASDIASDALGAFNMSTEPQDIEKNLGKINDVFAATVTSSNTTMETLFDTMKLAGPVTRGGVAMFGALAGTLGSAGIKGTIAATTLKNMFLRLQAPPSEAAKSLKKLGIQIADDNGNMKSMIDIIGQLNTALTGKSEVAREKFLKDIFGMRAIAGVNVLLSKGQDELQKYHDQLENSDGKAKEMADTMRNSLGVQLKVLHSSIMSKGMDIFTGLMGENDPADAVKELIDIVRDFNVGPVVDGLREIGRYAKVAAEFLWENRDMIMAIGKIWLVSNIAKKTTGFANVLGDLVQQFMDYSVATTGAADGMADAAASGSKLVNVLNSVQPLVITVLASLETGYQLYKAMEREQKRRTKEANENAKASMGLTPEGEIMQWGQKKAKLAEMKAEWKKWAFERRTQGEGELDLLTGGLSSIPAQRQVQETARALAWRMKQQQERGAEGYRIRQAIYRGEGPQMASDAGDYYYGQEWGDFSKTGNDLNKPGSTMVEQSSNGPKFEMTWNPKQEVKVNVTVNGAPEGTTASATVEDVPSVPETALGIPYV